jgi:maltose alpha-D-glucosyltransferase / alpha-amylase
MSYCRALQNGREKLNPLNFNRKIKLLQLASLLLAICFHPAAEAAKRCERHFGAVAAGLRALAETPPPALLRSALQTDDPKLLARAARDFAEASRSVTRARPFTLRALDASTDPAWPKDSVEYMFYPNQFGSGTADGTFRDATRMLPYLQELGVDTLYPLPFLRSAGLDGGFDVIDFMRVDAKLGGNKAFDEFLAAAKKRGMKVKMDLILNHVSDQHDWFQRLLKGDERYRNYFITRDKPPEILRRYDDETGKVVVYREFDAAGKPIEVHRRLIFPDISDTHYREVTLENGKKLWVYHTFYPFQLDLNYGNPDVLKEAYQLLGHWSNKGVDIFRLDAIPFLDKTAENHPRTHAVVELLGDFLRRTAPRTRLKVEACQKLDEIVKYFGGEAVIPGRAGAGTATGAPAGVARMPSEAQLAYQFEGMSATWLSLLSRDKRYFEDFRRRLDAIPLPENAVWANFLRVHDELTLEMVPEAHKSVIQLALLDTGKGVPFREGNGVAGRMADFLDNDPDRIRLAFSILMSQEGMPVIYFGDEIAARGSRAFMEAEEARRKAYFQSAKIDALSAQDARDVGRGPIPQDQLLQAASAEGSVPGAIFRALQNLIARRKESPALLRGGTEMVPNNRESVLSYLRQEKEGGSGVLVLHNLGEAAVEVDVTIGNRIPGPLKDLLTGKALETKRVGDKLRIKLPRYGSLWLEAY